MTHATRQLLFRLSAAYLAFALTSCAHAADSSRRLEQFAWSSTSGAARAPRVRSVALVVNNQCAEPIAIHVLREGARAERLGYVGGRQSRLFDITRVAPVGSAVRFAGDRQGVLAFISDEVWIRRPGSILVEVEPRGMARNGEACEAPARWHPSSG